jgi:putative membrane protein
MIDLWLKALHIVFVIAWMAGLMMYPRLKIYQLSDVPGSKLFEEMKLAALRLRKIILTPSLIGTWGFGLALLGRNPDFLEAGWLHVKLALVIVITGFHLYFTVIGKRVDAAEPGVSAKKLRMMNEVPFLAMIGIVILVIVKPF